VRLQGYVLSAVDSSAIFNTELFVEDQHIKSRTNENGFFIIKNLCPGFILLELDLPNRKHIHLSARITLDTLLYIYVADDIVTTGSAEIRSANTVKFEINNHQLLDQTGKPLSEQLELLPGIQSLKTGNNVGKPMVQGLSGVRLPIYINGARQEGQQWGNDHGPEIDPLGSDQIEWLHGAQTLKKTHDALGGLLLLNQVFNGHNGEFDATGGWAFSTNGLQNACFGKILSRPFNKQY
jgi:iron complex outermembrane receptor protein